MRRVYMLSSDLLGAGSSIRSAGNARSTAGSSGTGVSRSLAAAPSAHSAEIVASRRDTAVFFWVDDDGTSVEGETSARSISMSPTRVPRSNPRISDLSSALTHRHDAQPKSP